MELAVNRECYYVHRHTSWRYDLSTFCSSITVELLCPWRSKKTTMSFQPTQTDEQFATGSDANTAEGERGLGKKILIGGGAAAAALYGYKRYKRHKANQGKSRGVDGGDGGGEEEEVVELQDGTIISAAEFDRMQQQS